ncbi:MAG: hypothetical protein QOF48_3356 [Verrucomicrobiota bacterium]|jgi:protein SCO1/2/putative membrane protein
MTYSSLPAVNASLNGLSACLLVTGWFFIRRQRRVAHACCMCGAVVSSTIFLACYVYYHYMMKKLHGAAHTTFLEPAWFRPIYLAILFTHLAGAVVIVPLVLVTLMRAARRRFDEHKQIARWTFPIWLYVSVTGVVIYLLLYQIFPQTR